MTQFKKIFLKLIRFYQKFLSLDSGCFPFFSPFFYHCRFYPTCSDYAYQAILKYGILKGGIKAILRILKCNPFSKGGYHPLK